jgi:hypothetical protein
MKRMHGEISVFVLYKNLVRLQCRRKVVSDVIEIYACLGQFAASIFGARDLKMQAGDPS